MAKILFIHDNFPAQFGQLGQWLAARGWDVTYATAANVNVPAGIRLMRYRPHRLPSPATHPYAQPMDRAAINAQALVRSALRARAQGYRPDVIVSHSGWGAGMFARDVFPDAAFVSYCEWWYNYPAVDAAYLRTGTTEPLEGPMYERSRNAPIALDITSADMTICPTNFQASQFPSLLRNQMVVEHDGIDTEFFSPDPDERKSSLGGLVGPDSIVVSYATRGMEPHRGFPQFMAALPTVLAARPDAIAVIAGENRVAYGDRASRGTDWKAKALSEHDINPARVRFTGTLSRADYLRLLRRSDAHVYLTVPFVLSWSMIEAMSVGCPLILSDTAPVREFADTDRALLVNMRDPADIAKAIIATVDNPVAAGQRASAARRFVVANLERERAFASKEAHFRQLVSRKARP